MKRKNPKTIFRPLIIVSAFLAVSCNTSSDSSSADEDNKENERAAFSEVDTISPAGNSHFRDLMLTYKESQLIVEGKARTFEAQFNYELTSDDQKLLHGTTTASTGAPGWGDFQFTLPLNSIERNKTYRILLFEKSAKDGSRTGLLKIPLNGLIDKN